MIAAVPYADNVICSSNHPASAENPQTQEEPSQDPGAHTRHPSASSTIGPQTKCRVHIYSLHNHQVVKTLDHLDNEEAAEISGIQSNDRVIALVNFWSWFFSLQLLGHVIYISVHALGISHSKSFKNPFAFCADFGTIHCPFDRCIPRARKEPTIYPGIEVHSLCDQYTCFE